MNIKHTWLTLVSILSVTCIKAHQPAIILFGPQGSGKSTFANILVQECGYARFSLGDELRLQLEKKSEMSKELYPLIKRAQQEKIAPDALFYLIRNLTLPMITNFVTMMHASGTPMVLDGIIRNLHDIEDMQQLFEHHGIDVIAVHLMAPDATVHERIQNRLVCLHCKSVFNRIVLSTPSALCPICQQPLSIRQFDDPESVDMRLKFYHGTIEPLLQKLPCEWRLIQYDASTITFAELTNRVRSLIISL